MVCIHITKIQAGGLYAMKFESFELNFFIENIEIIVVVFDGFKHLK